MDASSVTNKRTDCNKSKPNADQSSQVQQPSKQQHHDSITTDSSQAIYCAKIKQLRQTGQVLRSDLVQPNLLQKPAWFDETLFENAKSVYERHFMGVNFAHLSGLLLLVRINSIYRTLSRTGKSDSVAKLFNRYYQTVIHVKKWYEGDLFDENSDAHRSLLIVRGMHNKVSSTLNTRRESDTAPIDGQDGRLQPPVASPNSNACAASAASPRMRTMTREQTGEQTKSANGETAKLMEYQDRDMRLENVTSDQFGGENGTGDGVKGSHDEQAAVHISQYDIMMTQFAFVGFIVTRAKFVGLIEDFNQHDLESFLHFWRVIGYYLGASDEYNLCSRQLSEVTGLCDAIMEVEFKQSILDNPITSPHGVMGVNIVRSIKFVPMLTIYGITKYLYELIDIDTSEFEARATRYSRLSYTLIKLVMSRLLAYKAFRWFNNGLTRLSVYFVGKIENTFMRHLESKYGQELKPL